MTRNGNSSCPFPHVETDALLLLLLYVCRFMGDTDRFLNTRCRNTHVRRAHPAIVSSRIILSFTRAVEKKIRLSCNTAQGCIIVIFSQRRMLFYSTF